MTMLKIMDKMPRLGRSLRSLCLGLCLSFLMVVTTNAYSEKEILENFFVETNGDQWIVKTNWATEEEICSWFGVTCGFPLSNSSGVISLDLKGNNVAREVPELLYQMPFLEKIDLRHNPIEHGGFTGMARAVQDSLLSPLKSIDFGYCLLTNVEGLEDAPETLEDLRLTKNQISAGFPSEILSLTNLQKLYLNFNDMEGSLPTEIGNLKLLKELYLFSNKITGNLPTEIGLLDKMEFFTLGDNLFQGSIPSEVNNMLNLQIFSVHASDEGAGRLTGKLPSFSNAGYLQKISLTNNELTGSIPDDFLLHNSNTDEIVSINLRNNKISGTIPESMTRFENLDLDLVGNEIEGPLPGSFCDKGRWMSGLVEQYGCNAILCPPGFYNNDGMQAEDQHPCAECVEFPSPYFGATQCGSPPTPPELKILAELYLTLQGSQWEQNDGWNQFDVLIQNSEIDKADLSELVPCAFFGVICSNAGQVEILTLVNNGLRGKIPPSIFKLSGLVSLDMSYNYVDVDDESGGFAALKEAAKLARLKLSHTNIASLEGIGQAVTLEELHLDGSDFESSLPSELFDLTNLRVLHLDASFLTGALPPDIKRLSGLTRLQLNENEFQGQIPKELGQLTDLEHLDLSDNDFGGQLPPELNELSKLRSLRINKSRGNLTGDLLGFDRLEVIEELELFSNLLSGSIPTGFLSGKIDKSGRIKVRLNGNQLNGAIPSDLAEFTNMELDLEDNSISDIPQSLCENHDDWMSGEVGLVDGGCDAILCRPGSWSPHGKAVSSLNVNCAPCEANTFFGETACEATGAVRSREAEILDNFFSATGGRYWSETHTNWTKPSIPICYREGVKCGVASDDGNSGVTELRLNSFGMRGKIPAEIFELPFIAVMAFSHNPVGIELFGIGKSTTLEVLLLSETDLRNLNGMENAPTQLYEFHAAKNQMIGRFPTQLLQLPKLRKLLLNDNILTGTIPSEITEMGALRELGLWNNLMHGPLPTELGQLTDLLQLEVQNNFFSGLLPTQLGDLSKLEHIDLSMQLSNNKLTGPLFDFATNPRLFYVNLSDNSFAGTIPSTFLSAASETALITLDLSHNQLSGSIPIEIKTLTQLDIRLTGNMIDTIPDALCDISGWMGGLVGETESCNAIMCPPGTFTSVGRQTDRNEDCQDCNNVEEAPYFGSTSCAKVDIERIALIDFYEETDGSNWAFQAEWLSDDSVCTWYGIECNANSSVVGIRLNNNRLANTRTDGDGSASLFNLPNLEIIHLVRDKIRLDLNAIRADSKLETLVLTATDQKSLQGIQMAKKLRTLRVSESLLTGSFPSEVLEVTTLRHLYLSFNSFGGTVPSEIDALTALEELYLSGNDLSGALPSEIAELPELRELSFAGNLLSGTIPSEVSRMPFLKIFDVQYQRGQELITGPVPNFAEAPDLIYFDASGNDLSGSIPSNFLALPRLVDNVIYIILENNEISGTIPESLDPLTKLNINLADNRIIGIPEVLCDNDDWMNGAAREFYGCLALLCPAGSYSESGRQTVEHPCVTCASLVPSPFFGQTTCSDETSERLVLEYLFSTAGGEQWRNNSLWMTDAPICSWGGIWCTGDKQDDEGVEKIELPFNDMVGTLPSQVWSLASLRELHLTGNKRLSVSFETIGNDAASLEKLYLSQVDVQSLEGVSHAPKLTDLFVAQCGLTGTLPSDLYKLAGTLEQLDISWNFLVGTLSSEVGKLTNLSLFEGNGNDFHGTLPTEIGLLSNLENLIFAENFFSGQIPTELSSLPRLKGLSFSRLVKSGRKLSGGLPAFDKTPQLQSLVLNGNELTGSIPSNFMSSASGARFVDLSSNFLTGSVPVGLDTIAALDLRLIGNQISALPSVFCDNSDWMEGGVGKLESCNAIMCPPNFASPDGRATKAAADCQPCPTDGAPFYGSTSCSPIADERAILTQFYEACNGQDWHRNDYWNSAADICDWYGVGCENGKVILINLEANHVTGSSNEGLFDLPKLQVLWLGSNNIDFSFRNIGSARNLMDLQLDQIGLKSVEGLNAAKSLTSLDLSFNRLEGTFPVELLALENMRSLNLRSNSLNGPLPPSSADQRFIRHLRLDDNDFSGDLPSYSDLTVLRNLYLGNNRLNGMIPDNFLGGVPPFAKLVVDLSHNELTGKVPSSLGRLEELTIYLRENQFTGLAEELCEKTAWMDGEVGSFGCDAILCAPGTSTYVGRQSVEAGKCVKCPDAEEGWFGETLCPGLYGSSARSSMGYTALGLFLGLGITLISLI